VLEEAVGADYVMACDPRGLGGMVKNPAAAPWRGAQSGTDYGFSTGGSVIRAPGGKAH
jgi:hypothetical protein